MKKFILAIIAILAVLVAVATIETAPIITALAVAVEFFAMRQLNK